LKAKQGIGVEIAGRCVRAVRVALRGDGLSVEWGGWRDAPQPAGADASAWAIEAVRSLLKEAGCGRASAAAVALGDHDVYFHEMSSDLTDVGRLRKVLSFEVEDEMPASVDGLVLEAVETRDLARGRKGFLAAAAQSARVLAAGEAIRESGARSAVVSARAYGLVGVTLWRRRATEESPFVVCAVDEDSGLIALCQGRRVIAARQVSRLDGGGRPGDAARVLGAEIEMTWRRVLGQGLPDSALVVLVASGAPPGGLEQGLRAALGRDIEVVDALEDARLSQAAPTNACSPVALGMALCALGQGEALNFLEPEVRRKAETAGSRLALSVTAILLTLACAAWSGGVALELQRLESRARKLKTDIRQAFAAVSPGDDHLREEVVAALMDEKLRAARKEYDVFASLAGGEAPPLRVLQLITSLTPTGVNAAISEISISGSTARIKGTIDSFQSLERLKASLLRAKEFTKVIENAGVGRNATTLQFTMTITLAAR